MLPMFGGVVNHTTYRGVGQSYYLQGSWSIILPGVGVGQSYYVQGSWSIILPVVGGVVNRTTCGWRRFQSYYL